MLVFCLFAACTVGFAVIAEEVIEQDTLAVDQAVLVAINRISSKELDSVFVIGTSFGGIIGVSVLALLGGYLLAIKRHWRKLYFFSSSIIGALVLNLLLKLLFSRGRPELWEQLIVETSYSFPSGHAMASSALAISAIVLMWNTTWRWTAVTTGTLYMLFIGFSRLYLGVHYPTDVIAGWLVAAAWVIISYNIFLKARHRKETTAEQSAF